MITPLLTEAQRQEYAIRMNGVPTKPIADVFSAQLAKQITRVSDLEFAVMCIQNALEMGLPHVAIEHCKRALKRERVQ